MAKRRRAKVDTVGQRQLFPEALGHTRQQLMFGVLPPDERARIDDARTAQSQRRLWGFIAEQGGITRATHDAANAGRSYDARMACPSCGTHTAHHSNGCGLR